MSLLVWLPLNGTLENKGLSDVTVTGTGSVIAAGKTGSCYSYSTNTYTYVNGNVISGLNKFSVCCWVYTTNSTSYTVFTSEDSNGYWQFVLSNNYLRVRDTVSGVTGSRIDRAITAIPVSTWTHVAIVYDNGVVRHYRNGDFIETLTFHQGASMNAHNRLYIGADALNSSYQGNCRVNDFRIYDHALSTKEIKELSQALILHYPLDGGSIGNPNMVLDSYYTISPWTRANLGTEEYKGKTAIKVRANYLYQDSASNTPARNIFPSMTFKENTQYTLSVDWCDHIRTDDNSTRMYLKFLYSDNTDSHIYSPTAGNDSDWTHRKLTSTAGKTVTGITTTYNSAGTVSIANLKIEEGTIETPCADGIDYAKVHDDSGYRRDGTITGALSLDTNTPRYQNSTSFNGSSAINAGRGSMVRDEITVSMWAYMDNWNNFTSMRLASCTQNGGWTFFYYQNSIVFYIGTGSSSNTYKYAGNISLSSLSSGWHHFAGTYDGLSVKLYVDGTLNASTTAYTTKTPIFYYSSNVLWVGAEADSNATTPAGNYLVGRISDFRIYATALSASEILDLYNSPVYIDDSGTMGAFEFVENSVDGQSIEKTGIVGVKNLIEYSDNLKLMPDGSVFMKLLRHNNPASKLFTEDNCWLNSSDPDLYSSLILLKNVSWMKNLSEYEFLACEKLTSSASENQYRWKQTSNPATTSSATGFQLVSGTSQYLTAGLANAGTHGCFDVDDANNYWCCCGSYSTYQGGTPGFNGVVTTGYIELYIRIPDEILKGYVDGETKFFNQSIVSGKLKEI